MTAFGHAAMNPIELGDRQRSLRLGLPDTSVQDLTVKNDDVVIATHGRGFYVLDDGAALLREVEPDMTAAQAPRITTRRPAAPAAGFAKPAAPVRAGTRAAQVTSDGITLDGRRDLERGPRRPRRHCARVFATASAYESG